MTDQEVAADHLRIIRSLMERATVYRAISAPAALFGGIIALVTGIGMALRAPAPGETASRDSGAGVANIFSQDPLSPAGGLDQLDFFLVWLGVLALVGLFNTVLLWRGSQARGEDFFSSGMKLALRSTAPAMLAGGLVSFVLLESGGSRAVCALLWVVFYSLALLGARSFAPRSMRWLAWMFFTAGLGLFVLLRMAGGSLPGKFSTDQAVAGLIMALTFGALHVVYAMIILCRPKGAEEI
ncbi:MAG: hypothetical protein ACR2RV_29890 [Verrucomicrobiales bacterium]